MKVAVLCSGGVDSSVALMLLHRQGYEVEAFYLQIWLDDELHFLGDCPWEEDMAYLKEITKRFKIPLHIVPFQKEYREKVVSYVIEELRLGRTPSPDILCNQYIKFGVFFDYLEGKGFDKISSGHYGRIGELGGSFFLETARDEIKDQSYFLSNLNQKQLSRILFPLGKYYKEEVRELAKEFKLPNCDRKDSQGICFLGKIEYEEFVKFHLGEKEGAIIERSTGKILGCHSGFWYYTIGQRKRLKLHGGPWYVVSKDIEKNIVYIEHQKIKRGKKVFKGFLPHWINGSPQSEYLKVKLRHGENKIKAKVVKCLPNSVEVKLLEEDEGIASGQSVVFYDGNVCLGRAMIQEV